jgi:phosphoglycolate phosphatase-like HAD superfamily hydrolase
MSFTQILALDFDGVLCDGMQEYWQTAWRTYLELWQITDCQPPVEMFERFSQSRSAIEYGWEMPVLACALNQNISIAELTENWIATRDRILKMNSIDRPQLIATFDRIRDNWIAIDLDGWLSCHQFYPGTIDLIASLPQHQIQPMIITTKEGRFVERLLAGAGIEFDRQWIWGKEVNRSKADSLRLIIDEYGDRLTGIKFVEDRLPTLAKIAEREHLSRVELYLADWGYNTDTERLISQQSSRIKLLSLSQLDRLR